MDQEPTCAVASTTFNFENFTLENCIFRPSSSFLIYENFYQFWSNTPSKSVEQKFPKKKKVWLFRLVTHWSCSHVAHNIALWDVLYFANWNRGEMMISAEITETWKPPIQSVSQSRFLPGKNRFWCVKQLRRRVFFLLPRIRGKKTSVKKWLLIYDWHMTRV